MLLALVATPHNGHRPLLPPEIARNLHHSPQNTSYPTTAVDHPAELRELARFDMYGDFEENMRTPTVWWIEGFAEYLSYSYRDEVYDDAIAETRSRGIRRTSRRFWPTTGPATGPVRAST